MPETTSRSCRGPALYERLAVLSRIVAAVAGGYVLTSLCTIVAARYLPMGRADAVMTATMSSFAIFTCAVIWVFAARSAWRAWAGLAVPALLLALLLALVAWGGSVAA
ncbi:MAG: DUF3649 domain-containing protein [Herbaspirillum sp.]|nr:DUF3649 domain-containing protein [Herbaspirillum sp.]